LAITFVDTHSLDLAEISRLSSTLRVQLQHLLLQQLLLVARRDRGAKC